MALDLPAGRHRVELRFRPRPGEYLALTMSGLTLATLAVLAVRSRVRGRLPRGPAA